MAVHVLVAEPGRGGHDATTRDGAEAAAKAGFVSTIVGFFANPTLLLASVASGAANFITYGTSNFATLFLMREKGMHLNEVAVWYALVVGVCMGGGIFVSGRLIDHFGVRSKVAYAIIPALSLLVALPFFICFVWAAAWQTALIFFCVPMFLNSFFLSAMVTFVQSEVHPDQRVISGALLLLVMNFIGLGSGADLCRDGKRLLAPHPWHAFIAIRLLRTRTDVLDCGIAVRRTGPPDLPYQPAQMSEMRL